MAAGTISMLSLIVLSEVYVADGSTAGTREQAVVAFALAVQGMSFQLAMLSLGIGSLMFCILLYRSKLVPSFIAILGLAGYLCLLASSSLAMAGFEPGWILFIPGGLFELVLPIWLIVKGFGGPVNGIRLHSGDDGFRIL